MAKKIRITKTEVKLFSELTDQEKIIYQCGHRDGAEVAFAVVMGVLIFFAIILMVF